MLNISRFNRHKAVWWLGAIPFLISSASTLLACDLDRDNRPGPNAVKRTDIVAGYGEKSFSERYHLNLALPLQEEEFLAILKRLKLHYQICGKRGTDVGLPPPRQQTTIDISRAETCYEIDGDRDPVRHTGEAWRAFTDQHHEIFYIENVFAYTGP